MRIDRKVAESFPSLCKGGNTIVRFSEWTRVFRLAGRYDLRITVHHKLRELISLAGKTSHTKSTAKTGIVYCTANSYLACEYIYIYIHNYKAHKLR